MSMFGYTPKQFRYSRTRIRRREMLDFSCERCRRGSNRGFGKRSEFFIGEFAIQ